MGPGIARSPESRQLPSADLPISPGKREKESDKQDYPPPGKHIQDGAGITGSASLLTFRLPRPPSTPFMTLATPSAAAGFQLRSLRRDRMVGRECHRYSCARLIPSRIELIGTIGASTWSLAEPGLRLPDARDGNGGFVSHSTRTPRSGHVPGYTPGHSSSRKAGTGNPHWGQKEQKGPETKPIGKSGSADPPSGLVSGSIENCSSKLSLDLRTVHLTHRCHVGPRFSGTPGETVAPTPNREGGPPRPASPPRYPRPGAE